MKIKAYHVISEAVHRGIEIGLVRAQKYLDENERPTDEQLQENVEREVMNELSEVVDWEDDFDGE